MYNQNMGRFFNLHPLLCFLQTVRIKKKKKSLNYAPIQILVFADGTDLQHLSQKNLSSAFKVSVELKFFKQLVIELFCSISRLRSKKVSSLAVTVSHLKHLVSFVSIPCIFKHERNYISSKLPLRNIYNHEPCTLNTEGYIIFKFETNLKVFVNPGN
ncbi:hypothetical protein HanRHA438_Chr09g0388561 [Helianthus annuus]|nr:hypothetical protein HanRHA438_Chr09g0388561 [Helianthus annuus]